MRLLLAALLAAVPAMAAELALPAPKGWTSSPSANGVSLRGPAGEKRLRPLISARFYANGSRSFKSLEEFVRRQTEPGPFAPEGTAPLEPKKIRVAGREAALIERDATETVGANSMKPFTVPMKERAVAVPAEGGFYALIFRAPASDKKASAAFDAALKAFKPSR